MNPAISLAMWRLGVLPGVGVVPYIAGQFFGSVLGVVVARAVWGPGCRARVSYAVLQPGPGWSSMSLFVAETLSMAVIVLLVGVCLAEPRLAPFVPWIVGGMIGLAVADAGHLDGGQRESGSRVRPGGSFGTDSLPLGVSARAYGGCDARDMGRRDSQAPPICTNTQTMFCGTHRDGSSLSS